MSTRGKSMPLGQSKAGGEREKEKEGKRKGGLGLGEVPQERDIELSVQSPSSKVLLSKWKGKPQQGM